ncbi:MAG TPA: SRPBCC family protein [Mycobacteriales bacterium]|nr:SRPBCC family protein [Mycobacteriales bacterium]
MSDAEATTTIAADPVKVYNLVSDLPRMGEWSPENTGGKWIGGATGAAVGAKFRGHNKRGVLRWSTTVEVVDATPGKRFAFEVTYGPVPISRWEYTFEPDGDGCRVTESWTERRPLWMKLSSIPVMAVADRAKHNTRTMEATLAALKVAAEAGR